MTDYSPPDGPLVILHRDPDVLLIDKPSGLLSVRGSPEAHRDCLEARVKSAFPEALLIHRLDRETSGIMVFAMNPRAQRIINLQFERRMVRKTYIARVAGVPGLHEGRIELPLTADWPNRPLQKVCHRTGRPAVTVWRIVQTQPGVSRLELTPETGRSHQLRIHLKEIGHAILGDDFYASPEVRDAAPRLQLHAAALRLRHPADGEWVGWAAPCPF